MAFGPNLFMFYTYFIIKFQIICFSKFKIGHSKKLQLKNAIKSNYWGGLGKIFNLEKLEIQSVQDLGKSSQLKPCTHAQQQQQQQYRLLGLQASLLAYSILNCGLFDLWRRPPPPLFKLFPLFVTLIYFEKKNTFLRALIFSHADTISQGSILSMNSKSPKSLEVSRCVSLGKVRCKSFSCSCHSPSSSRDMSTTKSASSIKTKTEVSQKQILSSY